MPAAEAHLAVLQQPLGQATEVVSATQVGTGAQQHLQPLPLRLPAELRQIVFPAPVELPRFRLMPAPEDVGAHGVQTQRLGHPQAVPPVLPRDARRVQFAGVNWQFGGNAPGERQ